MNRNKENSIDVKLFNTEAENLLYESLQNISRSKILSYRELYELLTKLVPVIDKFFEDVMVMDENIQIKNNRLRLLEEADQAFLSIADFTKIVK